MGLGMREHSCTLLDATAFRVAGAINQFGNAGLGDGRRTHSARFQCYIQGTANQALVAQCFAGGADGQYLGVGSGIAEFDCAVASCSNHVARCADYDRANRHFIA